MADKLMMGRRTFVKGGLAASALAALAGCGKKSTSSSAASDSTAKGGTFKFYIGNPVAIDPYNAQESEGTQVEHILFDALTDYDWDKEKVVPKAAKSWDVSDDGLTYTFHLVEGAKFHNGDTVDAKSFKRGWERIANPKMATPSDINYHLAPIEGYDEMNSGDATEISGLTCPDDNTFVVKLKYPMADWPYVCAHPALAPVPKAALDDPDSFLVAPIGNGPFQMDGKWVSDQYINVKKFDDYYGTKANLDAINFSIQKDPDTAYREFEAGNLDFCQIPSGRIKEIEGDKGTSEDGYTVTPGKQVLTGAETAIYYLCFNLQKKELQDLNVRKAINLAIDRQKICDTLFEGSRKPADGAIPTILDKDNDNSWEYAKYDADAAKKLVSDNNLGSIELELDYNSGGGHEDIMSIIQDGLEAAGFKVKQSSQEWAAYLSSMSEGSFFMGRLGWIADYPTMDNFIYPNFYTGSDNNYGKYSNTEVDKAIDEARQTEDDDERRAKYREINKKIGEDLPIAPIMFYAHNHVGSDRVQKMYYDPQGKAELGSASITA